MQAGRKSGKFRLGTPGFRGLFPRRMNQMSVSRTSELLRFAIRLRLWLALGAVMATAVARAATISYTATIVAKSGDTIGGKTLTQVFSPTLNDNGTVVFLAGFSGTNCTIPFSCVAIFTPSAVVAQAG